MPDIDTNEVFYTVFEGVRNLRLHADVICGFTFGRGITLIVVPLVIVGTRCLYVSTTKEEISTIEICDPLSLIVDPQFCLTEMTSELSRSSLLIEPDAPLSSLAPRLLLPCSGSLPSSSLRGS